jgi:VWFA-related protein
MIMDAMGKWSLPRRGAAAALAVALVVAAGPVPRGQEPTFRVLTRIATIDAVVVDGDGRHVTDLTPADFEIVERGKPQAVRQAVYVQVVGPDGRVLPPPAPPAPAAPAAGAAPTPPEAAATPGLRARPLDTRGRQERAGRVIAIVVDDLGLSFESTAYVRRMLTRYVDTQVAAGDLVAIIRTAGGVGALQQFTTDRRMLHAAIDRVRWSLQSRSGVAAFEAVTPEPSSIAAAKGGSGARGSGNTSLGLSPDQFKTEVTAAGSMGALEYVMRGMDPLPGRKSVVFVSEGFDLGIRDQKMSRAWAAFTRVMERANRAGVVVYTLDARGLQTAGLTAEDNPQPSPSALQNPTGIELSELVRGRAADRYGALQESQNALVYLAAQTGGFAILDTNDLSRGLGRALDDTRGYYLVGFDTAIAPGERWDPDDVRIRVKRPGLRVRARRGLFGPADKDTLRDAAPPDPLVAATLSPFTTGDLDVRLTTLFGHDKKQGSYVRTLFFIDPAGITFVDGPDGRHDADLTVLMLAIGDNGQAVGQARIEVPLRLDEAALRLLRQRGLLYSARVRIAEPGGYQVRAAVQDAHSKKIGTSSQFVDVPKVGKNHVALSGVVMMDAQALRRQGGAGADASAAAPETLGADGIGDGVLGEPAIKIFRPGAEVVYTCEIYDGRGKREEGFSTRATLIRDGKAIYTSPAAPISGADKASKPVGSVPVGGTVQLGRKMPPGIYTLQVSVGPRSGRDQKRQASQWVDFEVR